AEDGDVGNAVAVVVSRYGLVGAIAPRHRDLPSAAELDEPVAVRGPEDRHVRLAVAIIVSGNEHVVTVPPWGAREGRTARVPGEPGAGRRAEDRQIRLTGAVDERVQHGHDPRRAHLVQSAVAQGADLGRAVEVAVARLDERGIRKRSV